ncbi:bifunctional DNA primase/polymerase [Novosphingobium sp. RD2P27]|uniref:Bifunctional DNA primase/polymerase n=1 Tax=Novosphingobium kalidii TaxID=3230299 RepID=A0ABV2D0Z7_9SPHN
MTPKVGQVTSDELGHEIVRYADTARVLLENGYVPIPIPRRSKRAKLKNWQTRSSSYLSDALLQKEIQRYPNHGVALRCGSLIALDLDWTDPRRIAEAQSVVRSIVAGDPLVREGQAPRRALLYLAAEPIRKRQCASFDIQGTGTYIMAFGIHPTGQPYRWVGRSPMDVPLADLPVITSSQVDQIIRALAPTPAASQAASSSMNASSRHSAKRVLDGRDALLTAIVYEIWSRGMNEVDKLAAKAWRLFEEKADLSRPKRGGTKPWTIADARQKAKYLLARAAEGKVKRSTGFGEILTYSPALEPFARATDALGARGHLSPSAVRLSQLMLCFCRNGSGCYVSVEKLARQLDLAQGSVKRLRARLVAAQLWIRRVQGKGRGSRSEYVPCLEAAIVAAEKVTALGALITSRGGEEGLEEPHREEKRSSNIEDFISLGRWSVGGGT